MLQTHGLTHLQITVKDLRRSAAFYQGMFGMKELRRFGDEVVMLRTPGSHEVLTINADPKQGADAGKMGGIAHFGFRLREPMDMRGVLELVESCGGKPLEQGGSREKGRLYAFATDPDGYEVEIFWEKD